jgi:hypothetical protein
MASSSDAPAAVVEVENDRPPVPHLVEHEADPQAAQRGYIKGTDYSTPYTSNWSRIHVDSPAAAELYRHMNCSYLSTHGHPPTLLALKQHAQALCNLILTLNPSRHSLEIDGKNAPDPVDPVEPAPADKEQQPPQGSNSGTTSGRKRPRQISHEDPLTFKYDQVNAFDFLTDLSKPYTNDEDIHHLALNSLANEVSSRSDVSGTSYHCALASLPAPRPFGAAPQPYANHHNLIMHANACLERLDHEFSSEGGLMAILPGDEPHEADDKKAARNSLLGQWFGFTQPLVRRMHELEIAYGNALDLLEGDQVVPLQALSAAGPDARSVGRQIAFPQDKWVLANAGDDVFEYVHDMLDKKEAAADEMENYWRIRGLSGQRTWYERQGKTYARGIVAVNVNTRFYRLKGEGHGTVFVVPGWEHNPATEYTKIVEKKPGIVGTPMAKWPVRVTELEAREEEKGKGKGKEEEEKKEVDMGPAGVEAMKVKEGLGALVGGVSVRDEINRLRKENLALQELIGLDRTELAREVEGLRARVTLAEETLGDVRAAAEQDMLKLKAAGARRGSRRSVTRGKNATRGRSSGRRVSAGV